MGLFRINQFLGERPGRHPQKLAGYEAQAAKNVRLLSQTLEPFRGRALEAATTTAVRPRTIFKDANGVWLEFSERTHVTNSVVGNDPYDRVFFTDSNGPSVSDGARRMTGSGPYPGASLKLGVPFLDDSPVATVTDEGDELDEDGVENSRQSRVYLLTLSNSFGEEGVPSLPSDIVRVFPGSEVSLALPAVPGGNYDLEDYNVYRLTDGVYQYVGSTPVASTTFVDTLDADLAQEGLESLSYYPPPDGLRGLTAVAGSFLAGIRGNEVLFSESGLPHAWPLEYRQPVDAVPRAIASYGSTAVVLTDGQIYMAQGSSPSAMVVTETAVYQACVSEESVAAVVGGVAYASPDGLIYISDAGIAVATSGIMTDREWAKLNPATIRAVQWQGVYFASYDGEDGPGAFMFDPRTPEVGILPLDLPYASAIYTHPETDTLYMVDGDGEEILAWDADPGSVFAAFRYRSRPMDAPAPVVIQVVQVKADDYPMTLRVFADGVEQSETVITSIQPQRIAGGRLARSYSLEVEGVHRTYDVIAATTMVEMRRI